MHETNATRIGREVMEKVSLHIEAVQFLADGVVRLRYIGAELIGDERRFVGEFLEVLKPRTAAVREFFRDFLKTCRENGIDGTAVLRHELVRLRREMRWSRRKYIRLSDW